jgi:hypothetical protein
MCAGEILEGVGGDSGVTKIELQGFISLLQIAENESSRGKPPTTLGRDLDFAKDRVSSLFDAIDDVIEGSPLPEVRMVLRGPESTRQVVKEWIDEPGPGTPEGRGSSVMGPSMPENPHVFISYAHVNNQGAKGWVTNFFNELKVKLDSRAGRMDMIQIWFDLWNLRGHQRIPDAVKRRVAEAATLLPVLSHGYLKSGWCREELVVFLEKERRGGPKTDSSVFLVEYECVEKPKELEGLAIRGYRFWDRDPKTWRPVTLGTEEAKLSFRKAHYAARMHELANDLEEHLRKTGVIQDDTGDIPITIPLWKLADFVSKLRFVLVGWMDAKIRPKRPRVGPRSGAIPELTPTLDFGMLIFYYPAPVRAAMFQALAHLVVGAEQ